MNLAVECISHRHLLKGIRLTNRGLGIFLLLELNDTGSTRAAVGLILDLSALNFANGREELYKILVAGRPGQVADVDGVAWLSATSSKVSEGVGGV